MHSLIFATEEEEEDEDEYRNGKKEEERENEEIQRQRLLRRLSGLFCEDNECVGFSLWLFVFIEAGWGEFSRGYKFSP